MTSPFDSIRSNSARRGDGLYSLVNVALGLLVLIALPIVAMADPGDTALISVTVNGLRAAGSSEGGSTSADGRYVLFRSTADAVGYGGPGPVANLFVRDQVAGTTEPVRIEMIADQAMLSANGRFVAFASGLQIYVHDRQSALTQRVSVRSGGAPSLEGDYREPFISATGRYVVFVGERSDLAPEYPNDWAQVFLHDRQTRTSEAVSVNLYGGFTDDDAGAPSVTPDGRYVVFHSQANNLVPNDIYGDYDIFVRDRHAGTTERVSLDMHGGSLTGRSLNGSISADGRYVAFWSDAPDVVPGDSQWHEPDIFIRDRLEARTERVTFGLGGTQPNSGATGAMISATGRYVMFTSDASNIVEHDTNEATDVFVRDRVARTTERVSLDSTGAQLYAPSRGSSITYGGRRVVIESAAPYIVANDFNASSDVYMREIAGIGTGTTAFTLRPGALDFGDQRLFTSETRRFWLQNTGNVPLPILDVTLRGANKLMFRVDNTCGASVPPAQGCAIRVTFRPTSVGPKTAVLRLVLAGNLVRTLDLTGAGVKN